MAQFESDQGLAYDQLRPLVSRALGARLSVLLRGHPGVGKSSLARELAMEMDLPLIDIRLAQREPAELAGVYIPDRERQVMTLLAPDWVRAACERPHMVFLDEINAAVTRLHQAAAYQIVLERRVGPFEFHPDTVVMAAGNLDDDQSLTTPLSAALNNRFVHFTLKVEASAWLRWGEEQGVHPAVLGYVASKGPNGSKLLYDPTGHDAFPTPRSWAMASQLLQGVEDLDQPDNKRLIAACVGQAAAEKFFAYLRIYDRIDPTAIIQKGKMPQFAAAREAEPSFVWAATYAVADWIVRQTELPNTWLPNILKFLEIRGLDAELQLLFLRRCNAIEGLVDRLKALPEYRRVAGDLVRMRASVYA